MGRTRITASQDLPEIEVGREPRYVLRVARSKPTIYVEAVEVGPSPRAGVARPRFARTRSSRTSP